MYFVQTLHFWRPRFGAHLAHKDIKKRTKPLKCIIVILLKYVDISRFIASNYIQLNKKTATHNPKVVGSNPASATNKKAVENRRPFTLPRSCCELFKKAADHGGFFIVLTF